ncbi:MAG TPA: DUF885 family protein, partial [Actinomycetaceae bacterium]|nr:DUF885 family protein [Actinomycetaceae bacterium]
MTPIDAIAETYVEQLIALDPLEATAMGLPGHDDELPDLSPDGHLARAELASNTIAELAATPAQDEVDVVTRAAMTERLGIETELFGAAEYGRNLNVIASPVQSLREVFDLMPADGVGDWDTIAARLAALPAAMESYQESLRQAAALGKVAAVRQVEACIAQAEELAAPGTSFFDTLVGDARPGGSAPTGALGQHLESGAAAARQAYGELAQMLRTELAPQATEEDAVGRERYAMWSRYFLGTEVDLDETY